MIWIHFNDDDDCFLKLDNNLELIEFAKCLEETCIKTVENGEMTKDLAILINKDQKWLNTQDFLSAIKNNFFKLTNKI